LYVCEFVAGQRSKEHRVKVTPLSQAKNFFLVLIFKCLSRCAPAMV